MIKKTVALSIILIHLLTLTGCWSYKEIESLIIVAGAAIDKSADGRSYHVTIETIDLSGAAKDSQPKSLLYEADGATMLDAARNAKKLAPTKFYWSNCQILILGQAVAKEGIIPILDIFLRSQEPRDTIEVLVSKDKTAKEILTQNGLADPIISFGIDKALETDANYLSTASYTQLNYIFNTLAGKGRSLVLPVVHNTLNNNKLTGEVIGDAVFQKDKLLGFLSSEETKYSLFIRDEVKGGLLIGVIDHANYTLEIHKNQTNISHGYKDGKLTMKIKTETNVALSELETTYDYINELGRESLKKNAQDTLEENVKSIVELVQTDFGVDIFGFGESIEKTDPKLWKELKSSWGATFKTLQVEVSSEINIETSLAIRTPIKVGD